MSRQTAVTARNGLFSVNRDTDRSAGNEDSARHPAGTGNGILFRRGLPVPPPGDIYEACDIDGANLLQRLFYVTIPMLKETFIINIVLVVTGVFKIYELVYQMTGGGPAHQSELLTSYMYFTVFTSRRYGYGMAIAVAILLLSILGSFSYIKITTRKQRS